MSSEFFTGLVSICIWLSLHSLTSIQAQSTSDNAYLIFARRRAIQRMNLNGSELESVYSSSNISSVGLDIDVQKKKMYWSNSLVTESRIIEMNIDGTGYKMLIKVDGGLIEGVAWDWINEKLYWTDRKRKTIAVLDPKTKQRKTLVNVDNGNPRGIVVDPLNRLLYWSEYSSDSDYINTAKIVRMSMDGTNSVILFDNRTVNWPNGLALDYESNTLYWIDTHLSRRYIGKSRTDGSGFTIIKNLTNYAQSFPHAFAMEYHRGYLYWSDWLNDAIFSLRENDPQGTVMRVQHLNSDPGGIQVVDAITQPTERNNSSPCSVDNGGCSHLCLLSATQPSSFSCVCPDGVNPELCTGPTSTTDSDTSSSPSSTVSTRYTGAYITGCEINQCKNGGTCYRISEGFICTCPEGYFGSDCGLASVTIRNVSTSAVSISVTVFVCVFVALLLVIIIMTLLIAAILFVFVRSKYGNGKIRSHSLAGLTDSPRDSPTHVVVERLSDHDYISIKSRDSPAPRGIVINIENLGSNSTSSQNQYNVHEISSTESSNTLTKNGSNRKTSSVTTPLPNGNHTISLHEIMKMNATDNNDTDSGSDVNSLEHRGNCGVSSDV